MTSFAAHIADWHDFFSLAGSSSATLLGLLFVGVSLQRDSSALQADTYTRTIAIHNFQSFLIVILFALYFVSPNPSPASIGWPLVITAAFPIWPLAKHASRYRERWNSDRSAYIWHFLVPMICYLAAGLVGVALLFGNDGAIDWMVAVIALLLMIPTRNAWKLMLQPARDLN